MLTDDHGDLPTVCECGGKLHYDFGPGDYISCYCDRCTPVVRVEIRERKAKGGAR